MQDVYADVGASPEGQLSVVSTDFHVRFAGLLPEARTALVEADVFGKNDGSLTVAEYADFNRKGLLRGTGRFQRQFGDEAHEDVLEALIE